jgi:hypothetical protein
LRSYQVGHFRYDLVYRSILGSQPNQSGSVLEPALEIRRAISACLRVYEVSDGSGPWSLEQDLSLGEKCRGKGRLRPARLPSSSAVYAQFPQEWRQSSRRYHEEDRLEVPSGLDPHGDCRSLSTHNPRRNRPRRVVAKAEFTSGGGQSSLCCHLAEAMRAQGKYLYGRAGKTLSIGLKRVTAASNA